MIQELTLVVDRILEIEEDCFIEVCGAGRAASIFVLWPYSWGCMSAWAQRTRYGGIP